MSVAFAALLVCGIASAAPPTKPVPGTVGLRQHTFQRQHDTRRFAAGGDLRQRTQRFAGIGTHHKL